MDEQYWVQVDGGPPYVIDDSGRLLAVLYGIFVGVGESSPAAHGWAMTLVDRAVEGQVGHTGELKDGRVLRLSIVRPGEVDE